MVLAVDENYGSVRALIRFLPMLAIERAAVKGLVLCRTLDLDASFRRRLRCRDAGNFRDLRFFRIGSQDEPLAGGELAYYDLSISSNTDGTRSTILFDEKAQEKLSQTNNGGGNVVGLQQSAFTRSIPHRSRWGSIKHR